MTRVRYAVVGAGWISQEAFMPGVASAQNSELTAIVSGSPEAAAKLAEFWGVRHVCGYEDYQAMLASDVCDAVYVATPNSLHAEHAIAAAKAGKHAIVEKPLATTEAECRAMIAAFDAAGTSLLTAYRLHNEPGTVAVLEAIRSGEIGEVRHFHSVFTLQCGPENHRLKGAHWGGPLQDLGVYCLNAARQVFGSEPVAVTGFATELDDPRFAEVPGSVTATMLFPGGGTASFTASFAAAEADFYRVIGSEGEIYVSPAYLFQERIRAEVVRGRTRRIIDVPRTDHFAGMAAAFSDCILDKTPPESDGHEGLADVVIMRAIEEAIRSGRTQSVNLPPRALRPSQDGVRIIAPTDRRLVF